MPTAQLETLTARAARSLAPPWLTLGALQLELREPARGDGGAEELRRAGRRRRRAAAADARRRPPTRRRRRRRAAAPEADALTQAWLLLAQAAEQQRDYAAAEAWLAQDRRPAARARGAGAPRLAAGAPGQARRGARADPRVPEQDARRRARQAARRGAAAARREALGATPTRCWRRRNQRFPDDVDLLYEQAMMDEKLDRLDEMERLLRRVIELKPDNPQAYNALGYSLADRNLRLPEARTLIKQGARAEPGRAVHHRQPGLGRVPPRQPRRGAAPAARGLPGAARSRDRRPPRRGAVGSGPARRGARASGAKAAQRDAANDVLRETLARLRVDL